MDTTHKTTPTLQLNINRLFADKLPLPGVETRHCKKHDCHDTCWLYGAGFRRATLTLAQFEQLIREGRAFSLAYFDRDYRKKDYWVSSQLLGIDLDECPLTAPELAALPFIRDNAFLVYPTASHTPEKPKTRIIFVLSKTVTDSARWVTLQVELIHRLSELNIKPDKACKDLARFFYGSTQPGMIVLGNILSPEIEAELIAAKNARDEQLALLRKQNPPRPIAANSTEAELVLNRRWGRALDRLAATTSSRHEAVISTAGHGWGLLNGGWPITESDVVRGIMDACARNGYLSKVGEREIQRCIDDMRGAAPVPLEIHERAHLKREKKADRARVDGQDTAQNDAQVDPFAHLPDVAPRPRPEPPLAVLAVEPPPDYWLDGIPHGFITLLLNYDPDGALLFLFIMRAIAAGLLDAQMPFTHCDLLTARMHLEQTPHGAPSDDTIYKWFTPESPALNTVCKILYTNNSEFVTPINTDNSLGVTNSENYYLLRSNGEILRQLFHRARLDGLRVCYPVDEAGAVVPFDATLLKAIGCKQPDELAQAIEPVQRLVDQKIAAGEQKRADKKLRRYMQRVHRYADSREVIPFPDGMLIRTTADLRAALARGLKDADLLPELITKGDWMFELGIRSKNGVDRVLEKAGIHQSEHFENPVIHPDKVGQQIRSFGKKNRALLLHFELLNSEGQVVGKRGYQSDQQAHALVCDHAMTGGMVQAVYQLPNEYSLRELPPRKPRPPRVMSASEPIETCVDAPMPKNARLPRPKRYPGQVDPAWVREHQINLLYGLGWAKGQGGQTVYVNLKKLPKTPENLTPAEKLAFEQSTIAAALVCEDATLAAPENASIAELLALLSGVSVADIAGVNMPPEFKNRLVRRALHELPPRPSPVRELDLTNFLIAMG